jgi:hypothetical protein
MRIRTIKPGFWKSISIASLPISTRMHFIGLWNYCDDEGRGADDARLLKAELWPLDVKIGLKAVEEMQRQLAMAGKIVRYNIAGRAYFQVVHWTVHQRLDHPQDSQIPPAEDPQASLFPPDAIRESSGSDTGRTPQATRGKGKEGKGREGGKEGKGLAPTSVDAGALPNRSRSGRGEDPIFEVLFELDTGLAYSAANRATLTSDAAGVLNRAASQIRATGISPDGLRAAIGAWPTLFDEATCTAAAVKKHLPRLVAASNGAIARRSENQRDKLERELRAAR